MLADYLDAVAGRRWQPGLVDCCTFMVDWLTQLGAPDAMADRRGTYTSRAGYKAILKSEGGILACCRARLLSAGLIETQAPSAGDVALVMAPIGHRRDGRIVSAPVGAICVDTKLRAIVTPDSGVVAWAFPIIAAWSWRRG